jgi:hypothetical protein
MSYDLAFWRQAEGVTALPAEVVSVLLDGGEFDGLVPLDLEAILIDLLEAFDGAVRYPLGRGETLAWNPEDSQGMFEAWCSPQHVYVNCRGGLDRDHLNTIIDIALRHGCALYDPQTDERFKQGSDPG